MKGKWIQLLVKVMIPVVIIGGSFGVYKIFSDKSEQSFNKAVVVNGCDNSIISDDASLEVLSKEVYGDISGGLSKNYGFINNDEMLLGIGLTKEEFSEKYPDEIYKTDDELYEKAMNDKYGKVYLYNLNDSTKRLLGTNTLDVYSNLVPGMKQYAYLNDDKISIFNIEKNIEDDYIDYSLFGEYNNNYKLESGMSEWSKDGSTLISYDSGGLVIYNKEENLSKKVKVDDGERHVHTMPSYYSEDGKEVYFIGVKYKKNMSSQGIYKVNVGTESVEEVFSLPYTNPGDDYSKYSGMPSNDYCVLDEGKRIIFNGTIEGIDGTYIYNVEENKFYNVIPHTVKSEEGSYVSSIWLSPDKSKVIYIDLVKEEGKEEWNLYAANINGNSLTNRICIYKNIKMCESNISWSPDSKKIVFFTTDDFSIEDYFSFANKNEVNVITFK